MGISYFEYPWYHIHLFLLSDYRHNVIIYFLPQCCPHHKGLYPQIVSQKNPSLLSAAFVRYFCHTMRRKN